MQFFTKLDIFLNNNTLPGIFKSNKDSSKFSEDDDLDKLILFIKEKIVFFNLIGISFSKR